MKILSFLAGATTALQATAAFAQISVNSDVHEHRYALIDTAGNLVADFKLQGFRSYRNGFAAAEPGSFYRNWLDMSGKILSTNKYREVSDFNDQGFAIASNFDGPAIVVDRTGKEIRRVEAPASGMMRRRPPIAGVLHNAPYALTGQGIEKLGLINVDGKVLFPPTYAFIGEFSEGLAAVSNEFKDVGWIDTTGALVIPIAVRRAPIIGWTGNWREVRGEFHQGRAAISENPRIAAAEGKLEGFINRKGEVVIKPAYTASGDFQDGFARVRLQGDTSTAPWAFIDTTGKQIGPTYKYAWDFRNGYARVTGNDMRQFLIGRDMKPVPKLDGPFVGDMSDNGLIAVKRDGGVAYVRRDGTVAIPARKLSQYAVAGFEFTNGRTIAEFPGPQAGPTVAMVWFEIREAGQIGNAGRQYQILYAIVDAPESVRSDDLESAVTNKPRNSLARTVASGAYALPTGQREPDLNDILSRSAAKPRYTKDSRGGITWVDSVDPRYLGRFKLQ